jgi:hypothetical protein
MNETLSTNPEEILIVAERDDPRVAAALEKSAAAETAIARQLGNLTGALDPAQRELLGNALRLLAQLDGADDDRGSEYSRPYPPKFSSNRSRGINTNPTLDERI